MKYHLTDVVCRQVCLKFYTKNQGNQELDEDSRLNSVFACEDCNTECNQDVNACDTIFFLSTGENPPAISPFWLRSYQSSTQNNL